MLMICSGKMFAQREGLRPSTSVSPQEPGTSALQGLARLLPTHPRGSGGSSNLQL